MAEQNTYLSLTDPLQDVDDNEFVDFIGSRTFNGHRQLDSNSVVPPPPQFVNSTANNAPRSEHNTQRAAFYIPPTTVAPCYLAGSLPLVTSTAYPGDGRPAGLNFGMTPIDYNHNQDLHSSDLPSTAQRFGQDQAWEAPSQPRFDTVAEEGVSASLADLEDLENLQPVSQFNQAKDTGWLLPQPPSHSMLSRRGPVDNLTHDMVPGPSHPARSGFLQDHKFNGRVEQRVSLGSRSGNIQPTQQNRPAGGSTFGRQAPSTMLGPRHLMTECENSKDTYRKYPSSKRPLPEGITFERVCTEYPNHLWGEILLDFDEAGWNEELIWNTCPVDGRQNRQNGREWNYLQQRMRRARVRKYSLEAGPPNPNKGRKAKRSNSVDTAFEEGQNSRPKDLVDDRARKRIRQSPGPGLSRHDNSARLEPGQNSQSPSGQQGTGVPRMRHTPRDQSRGIRASSGAMNSTSPTQNLQISGMTDEDLSRASIQVVSDVRDQMGTNHEIMLEIVRQLPETASRSRQWQVAEVRRVLANRLDKWRNDLADTHRVEIPEDGDEVELLRLIGRNQREGAQNSRQISDQRSALELDIHAWNVFLRTISSWTEQLQNRLDEVTTQSAVMEPDSTFAPARGQGLQFPPQQPRSQHPRARSSAAGSQPARPSSVRPSSNHVSRVRVRPEQIRTYQNSSGPSLQFPAFTSASTQASQSVVPPGLPAQTIDSSENTLDFSRASATTSSPVSNMQAAHTHQRMPRTFNDGGVVPSSFHGGVHEYYPHSFYSLQGHFVQQPVQTPFAQPIGYPPSIQNQATPTSGRIRENQPIIEHFINEQEMPLLMDLNETIQAPNTLPFGFPNLVQPRPFDRATHSPNNPSFGLPATGGYPVFDESRQSMGLEHIHLSDRPDIGPYSRFEGRRFQHNQLLQGHAMSQFPGFNGSFQNTQPVYPQELGSDGVGRFSNGLQNVQLPFHQSFGPRAMAQPSGGRQSMRSAEPFDLTMRPASTPLNQARGVSQVSSRHQNVQSRHNQSHWPGAMGQGSDPGQSSQPRIVSHASHPNQGMHPRHVDSTQFRSMHQNSFVSHGMHQHPFESNQHPATTLNAPPSPEDIYSLGFSESSKVSSPAYVGLTGDNESDDKMFFPTMPAPGALKSASKARDLEDILQRFPNSLVRTQIAKEFLKFSSQRKFKMKFEGMLDILNKHPNCKHGEDMEHPDRRNTVKQWMLERFRQAREAYGGNVLAVENDQMTTPPRSNAAESVDIPRVDGTMSSDASADPATPSVKSPSDQSLSFSQSPKNEWGYTEREVKYFKEQYAAMRTVELGEPVEAANFSDTFISVWASNNRNTGAAVGFHTNAKAKVSEAKKNAKNAKKGRSVLSPQSAGVEKSTRTPG